MIRLSLVAIVWITAFVLCGYASPSWAACGTTANGTPESQSYLLSTEFQDSQVPGAITPGCIRDVLASMHNSQPNVQTGSYTLALNDAGSTIEVNSASAATVTIPTNSTVAFPVGTTIWVRQVGAGAVTVAAASGVTIDQPSGASPVTQAPWTNLELHQRASNEWVVKPSPACQGCSITSSSLTITSPSNTDVLTINPGTGGGGSLIQCTGAEANVPCTIQSQGIASTIQFANSGSTDSWAFGGSSAPGSGPDAFCEGPETTVSCNIQTKGFGNVYFYAQGGSATATLAIGPYTYSGAYPGPVIMAQGTGAVPLVLTGQSNGPIFFLTPPIDTAIARQTTGASYTVAAGIDVVELDGVTTPFTLTMPASPVNGQTVELNCGGAITLTVSANSGATMKGAVTACSATQGHKWRYSTTGTTWYVAY